MARVLPPELYIPDAVPEEQAWKRVTHLAIGAHQDDLEFMAFPAIAECYRAGTRGFFGIILTDGVGSIRGAEASRNSDREFAQIRREEQKRAATIGTYGGIYQLAASSDELRSNPRQIAEEIWSLIKNMEPQEVLLHSPFDKHKTHLAALVASIEALRRRASALPTPRVIGCEVWRGHDWLPDARKLILDASYDPSFATRLFEQFQSQIGPGKRYGDATVGRWLANATFYQPRAADLYARAMYGVDLSELVNDQGVSIPSFIHRHLEEFATDIRTTWEDLIPWK